MLRMPSATVFEPLDPDTVSPSSPYRAMKQLGLLLLCGAWVVLGLIGRDPWKTEDAITFGAAWEMLQRQDWLVPHIAQEPALHVPPLVPWLAALGMKLLTPMLDAPDAARLAVGVMLTLLLAFTAFAGRELNGRALQWMPVLIVVGSVGLFDRSHQLSPELGLTICVIVSLYAAALMARRPIVGGLLLGVAGAMGFLAAGWLGALWTLPPALLLPVLGDAWRSRGSLAGYALALVVAVVLGGAWPFALEARSPALFEAWRAAERLDVYFPFGGADPDPVWLARNLVWVAWPALPLILWMVWIRARGFNGGWRASGVIVPAVYALWMLAMLGGMPDPRLMQMLPLVAPLALLASLEIDSLKREHSAALDWFGILTFGLVALVLWGFWIDAYINGMSASIAIFLDDTETGYGTSFRLRAVIPALLLTGLWIVLVRPARRSNRRAVLNWATGMTLVWGLLATIWLPYLDTRRTYQAVGETIGVYRPEGSCMLRRNVGEAQRALFYYFGGVLTTPETAPDAAQCTALLVQYGRLTGGTPQIDGYAVRWEGARRGDDSERFVIYHKTPGS